ncbi:MAG: RNA-binding protein [Halobacteria archaeon]
MSERQKVGYMDVHYVDIRSFCYATESPERVMEALTYLVPPETEFDENIMEGHYGDEIRIYTVRIENADDLRHVLDSVDEILDEELDLNERVDEDCRFHLRLDKQSVYNEEPELGSGIELSFKMEAYPAKKPKAVDAVRRTIS